MDGFKLEKSKNLETAGSSVGLGNAAVAREVVVPPRRLYAMHLHVVSKGPRLALGLFGSRLRVSEQLFCRRAKRMWSRFVRVRGVASAAIACTEIKIRFFVFNSRRIFLVLELTVHLQVYLGFDRDILLIDVWTSRQISRILDDPSYLVKSGFDWRRRDDPLCPQSA
jgi:hypothetical protein